MAFYDLPKAERAALSAHICNTIKQDLSNNSPVHIIAYSSDADTHIRKNAYIAIGRIYFSEKALQPAILKILKVLAAHADFKVRQTVINAAGEIGRTDFAVVQDFFDKGLFDEHHSPRNAVIGSIKKMGEVNPVPVLAWAKKYLHHEDKEIRREICHGIELRGRTHPKDILPMLKELQYDKTVRVRNTLVHVLGQIAYKKGCLATVVEHLKGWNNKQLVKEALEEIIDVHYRYRDFAVLTQDEAREYISSHYP